MLSNHGRVIRRVAQTAAAAALLAVLPSGAAHGDGLTVTTSDGRTLHVGSVVATGQRDGDLCVFPDDVGIYLSGANTNSATLTADADCTLSVSRITAVTDRALADRGAVRPKYDESLEAQTQPTGVGGIGIEVVTDPGVSAEDLIETAKPKWKQKVYVLTARQTVFNAAGLQQYQDWFQVSYLEEWNAKEGRVRDLNLLDGACEGGTVHVTTGVDPTTDIRNCWYRRVSNGPATVSARSGGWYRHGWPVGGGGVTIDERKLNEYVEASYSHGWKYGCYMDREMPVGWSSQCWGERTSQQL